MEKKLKKTSEELPFNCGEDKNGNLVLYPKNSENNTVESLTILTISDEAIERMQNAKERIKNRSRSEYSRNLRKTLVEVQTLLNK